ncbi:MAG TPA: universal stress protein [Pyrinomonadaceae bacterium]|nr:universal stress protein [Pyrinomonadaceae bacterium]
MKSISKILIAYDGSPCSDAALNDLRRAGLPAVVEAVVVTVAYVFLPPPEGEVSDDELVSPGGAALVRPTQAHALEAVKQALNVAEQGAERVKTDFPGWSVKAVADGDAPAWAVIKMAGSFGADLIVIGSHGHSSAGGRLILGSVSQRVLYDAPCSVRVARCSDERREGAVRIIVGFDGSQDAEAAVDSVALRAWPAGSEARIITARGASKPEAHAVASEKLRAAGLTVSEVSSDGDPAHVLIKEAEEWGADCIFVGTRDLHGFQHLLHGSVSSAVAARALCSVEVARATKSAA